MPSAFGRQAPPVAGPYRGLKPLTPGAALAARDTRRYPLPGAAPSPGAAPFPWYGGTRAQVGIPVTPRPSGFAGSEQPVIGRDIGRFPVAPPVSMLGALPSISVAPWVRYGAVAGFLALAALRKVSWLVGAAGAAGAWFFLKLPSAGFGPGAQLTGSALLPDGSTVPINAQVNPRGEVLVGNTFYTVIDTIAGPIGSAPIYALRNV